MRRRDAQEEVRADIARTRAELGATVQELAGRMDVPARTRNAMVRLADRIREAGASPAGLAAAGAAVVAVVLLVLAGRELPRRARQRESGALPSSARGWPFRPMTALEPRVVVVRPPWWWYR